MKYGSLAVQGLYNSEVTFTSPVTVTSNSDIVLTGMTITPPAGTYLVLFSTWLTHNTSSATVTISIYADVTQKVSTAMTVIPNNGTSQDIALSTNGIVTVNGSQAIAIKWNTSAGTASAHNGTMDILKIA